jgi:chromosome segregation ATPase
VQEKVRRVTEALAEETRRRESAEQQAAEIGQRRSQLEAELAQLEQRYNEAHQQLQTETQLRQELQQAEKQLVSFLQLAEKQNYLVEQSRLEPRTLGLEAAEADAMQRVKRLTNALAKETRRREGAEQQAGNIGQRRSELEAQLAESQQTQARLHQELQESKKQLEVQRDNCIAGQSKLEARTRELDAFTNDLAALRSRIEEESLQRGKLAEKIVEAERAKAELATQAGAARDLVRTQENSIRALDSQVQQRQWEVHRLESLLQAEIAQRQQEQSKTEGLARQAAELTGQIEEKVTAQQRWHRRQSLLKQCIRRRKDQVAKAAAAARIQEAELSSLSSTIDEMRVVQSALCAQVRGLTTQHDSAARHVDELNAQSQAAARMIQARDQQLAALRHALLDAAHIGANLSRERLRGERQSVEGWKRMMATLLHTPLSLAQRRLVAEILSALEGWKQGRGDATKGVGFQVEPLDLNPAEFDCTEVIESALADVRKNAEESGTKVQAALVGQVPEFVYGSARHIHQLITLLGTSLPRIGRPKNLEVQVSFEAKQNGTAGMLLSLLLSPAHSHETLCRRLTTLTKASASLRAVRRRGSELTLSAAWQLALALGASSSIETTADQKVRVQISLPLPGTL